MRIGLAFSLVLLGLFLTGAAPDHQSALIDSSQLQEQVNNKDLRIIDARNSISAYLAGHIPGAVYLNLETLRISKGGTPATQLPPRMLAEIVGEIGISNENPVVVYSSAEDSLANSTYIATVLDGLGHEKVQVLNGGIEDWTAAKLPLDKKTPKLDAVTYSPSGGEDVYSTAERVQQKGQFTAVIDARTPQIHASGHIPGSTNLPIKDLLSSGTTLKFKSPEEIRKMVEQAGAGKGEVITYCTTGREASILRFALKNVAGFDNVKSYSGSMTDWKARELPVETGETTGTK